MIKVNFKDGTTLEFNLDKEDDLNQWLEWSSVKDFQGRITGIGILSNKMFHALTYPKRLVKVCFYAENVFKNKNNFKVKMGERLICHAGDIKLTLLVYTQKKPPILSTISLEKIGKQMFSGVRYSERKFK